jgi:hypothetical protein
LIERLFTSCPWRRCTSRRLPAPTGPAASLVGGASVLSTPKTPTPAYGNIVTVLSIDGGGVRGIIPGTILAFLEEELQVSLCCCVYIYIYIYMHLSD